MGWERRAVAAGIAWQQGQQQAAFAATADSRVPRGRECGNQQPSHIISSAFLRVMHAVHAIGA